MKYEGFFILAAMLILIGSWSTHFNVEGSKNQMPTVTPSGLTAIPVSPSQINLSWSAPTQNYGKIIGGYKIEKRLSSGAYDVVVYNTHSPITTYSIPGLQTGVEYTYRVSAVYLDDTSTDPSNTATATPTTTSVAPSTPITSAYNTNIKFDFVPSDGMILVGVIVSPSDYLGLQYKKDSRTMIINPIPTTELITTNLSNLLSYQNNHISSDSVPAALIAKPISFDQIVLEWMPPIQNYGQTITGYKVEVKNVQGEFDTIDDNTGNGTTKYSLSGLIPGHSYTYRVSAVYSATHSNPSNEATATTLVPVIPPEQNPGGISSSSGSGTYAVVGTPSNTSTPPNTSQSQINNVKFDFTAPDGNSLTGVILTQNDYQQFLVIKDPRTLLSNVSQTSFTANNSLAGLIRYQNLHIIQQVTEPIKVIPQSNSTTSPSSTSNTFDIKILDSIISSVVAIGIVGILTWFVKTKVARKIAKEYHYTLDKFYSVEGLQIRIRNSGETIEDCVVLCEKETCIWSDTKVNKPRHVYEGSISSVKIPQKYENENSIISVKSGNKILKKIRLDVMAHG